MQQEKPRTQPYWTLEGRHVVNWHDLALLSRQPSRISRRRSRCGFLPRGRPPPRIGKPCCSSWPAPASDVDGAILRAIELPPLLRGDVVEMTLRNTLRVAAAIGWRGLDGSPDLQPWLGRPPIAAGATAVFTLPLKQAGTMICEVRAPNGDPLAAAPMIVAEAGQQAADIDVTLLIEARRTSVGAGPPFYLVNQRQTPFDLKAPANARLRLRLLNASPAAFALQMADLSPNVVALDSQPCDPFQARDARVLLAPGTRIDLMLNAIGTAGSSFPIVLDDGTQRLPIASLTISDNPPMRANPLAPPAGLPSNGLPERLALATALRVDLSLNDERGWIAPQTLSPANSPAFRVKRGRTVVLALSNPSDGAHLFQLTGHHVRLLDKLDDGWKPYLARHPRDPGAADRASRLRRRTRRRLSFGMPQA